MQKQYLKLGSGVVHDSFDQNNNNNNNSESGGSPRSLFPDDWGGGFSGMSEMLQNLKLGVLYDLGVTNGLGSVVTESESIANKIISSIVSNGGNILYDSYLSAKMNGHTLSRNNHILERVLQQEYVYYDDLNEGVTLNGMHEDIEPPASHTENWKGLSVNIEKPQLFDVIPDSLTHRTSSPDKHSIAASSRKSRGSLTGVLRKLDGSQIHLGAGGSELGSTQKRESVVRSHFEAEKAAFLAGRMVDLSVPREIIREEEQLRVLKERETLMKLEKQQQEAVRSQELKEQQARLKGSQDINKKQFTYDFDGKFILTNPVKMEKLPPFNLTVAHSITKGTDPTKPGTSSAGAAVGNLASSVQQTQNNNNNNNNNAEKALKSEISQDDRRNSKKFLQPLQSQSLQQKQQMAEKIFAAASAAAGDSSNKDVLFENFKMASGVTLFDSIKPKVGPTFGAEIDIAALSLANVNASLSQPSSSSLRLTKSQYNLVTRSGNLSRQKNGNNSAAAADSDANNESALNNPNNNNSSLSFMLNDSKNKQNNYSSSMLLSKSKRGSHHSSAIHIADRQKLIETMTSLDLAAKKEDADLKERMRVAAEKKKEAAEIAARKSQNPVDEFNLQIAQNKHSVTEKRSSMDSLLPPIPTPRTNEYLRAKQAIGLGHQNPRDRAPKHVIYANLIGKRLPAPGIGKTVGHGFNSGYNPESIDGIQGILDKFTNNSSLLNGTSLLH